MQSSDEALQIAKRLEKRMRFIDDKFAIVDAGQATIRCNQRELEELFYQFVEIVAEQLGKAFIAPLLHSVIQPTEDMKLIEHTELNVNALINQAQQLKKHHKCQCRTRK